MTNVAVYSAPEFIVLGTTLAVLICGAFILGFAFGRAGKE